MTFRAVREREGGWLTWHNYYYFGRMWGERRSGSCHSLANSQQDYSACSIEKSLPKIYSLVVRATDCQCRSRTVLGSIPASSDTVESEGQQMKQRWIQYIEKIQKNPSLREIYFFFCVQPFICILWGIAMYFLSPYLKKVWTFYVRKIGKKDVQRRKVPYSFPIEIYVIIIKYNTFCWFTLPKFRPRCNISSKDLSGSSYQACLTFPFLQGGTWRGSIGGSREYWMISRGPDLIAVVWFDSSPTPRPYPQLSFSVFPCVAGGGRAYWRDSVEVWERGEGGEGGANPYDRGKAWSSINHSLLSGR